MEGWDGTTDGEPERSDAAALAALRHQRREADLGRRSRRGPARRPRESESAADHAARRSRRSRALREELVARAPRALRRRTPIAICTSACSSRTRAATRGPTSHDRPEPLAAYAHPFLDRRFPDGVRVAHRRRARSPGRRLRRGGARSRWDAGFTLRRRQALPRLPRPRAAQRARPRRAATAARSRTAPASSDRSSRASARAVPGLGDRRPPVGVRHGAVRKRRRRRRRAPETERRLGYRCGVRPARATTLDAALEDARGVLALLEQLGIRWICVTAGSPYYNPHVQRPALFPPTDGYQPPEDPLVGVARQIEATARLKARTSRGWCSSARRTATCRSGCRTSRSTPCAQGMTDFVGLGRMVLSYPELPADVLAGRAAAAQADLPHVQRLHDRPAHRPRVRLLSARPVLQVTPACGAAQRTEKSVKRAHLVAHGLVPSRTRLLLPLRHTVVQTTAEATHT